MVLVIEITMIKINGNSKINRNSNRNNEINGNSNRNNKQDTCNVKNNDNSNDIDNSKSDCKIICNGIDIVIGIGNDDDNRNGINNGNSICKVKK